MLRVLFILSLWSSQVFGQEIAIEGELLIKNQCTVIEKLEQGAMISCPGGISTRRLFNEKGEQFIVQKKIGDDFLVSDSKRLLQIYDNLTADSSIQNASTHKVEKSQVKTSIYFSLFSYEKNKWENDASEVPNKITVDQDKLRTLPLDFLIDFKFNEKLLLSLNPRFDRDGGEFSAYYGFGKFWLGTFADVSATKDKVTIEYPSGNTSVTETDSLAIYTGASLRYYHTSESWNVLSKLNVGYYREELDNGSSNEELTLNILMIKADIYIHHKINQYFAVGSGFGVGFGTGQLHVKTSSNDYYDDASLFDFKIMPINIMASF